MTRRRIGTVRSISKFEERFWLILVLAIVLFFVVAWAVALAWTFEDCVEVNFDHPDCDQYTTTTTAQVTTTTVPEVTTTQPEVTTTTPNVTTTVTVPETTVTTQGTTTTVQECPAGLVHQPPLCVTTTVQFFDTTTTAAVGIGTPLTIERLPHTGDWTALLFSLFIVLGLAGFALVTRNREAHE